MTSEQELNIRFSILQETLKVYGLNKAKTPEDIITISDKFYKFVTDKK